MKLPYVWAWTLLVCSAALALSACSGSSSPQRQQTQGMTMPGYVPVLRASSFSFSSPVVFGNDTSNGALQYWPARHGGGAAPTVIATLPELQSAYAMAANGNELIITTQQPASVILYDATTGEKTELPDPYGYPTDIAVAKDGSIYVVDTFKYKQVWNVAMYSGGTGKPHELSCSLIGRPEFVAVDDKGNVFLNGWSRNNVLGITEIPQAGNCMELNLRVRGYPGGLAFDPKSGALLVMDNPDQCAGGVEGRLTIYPKPYKNETARSVVLGANYCAFGLRLNASSTLLLYGDLDSNLVNRIVQQRTYPKLAPAGQYSGGSVGGFTTIPNTLPN
ncbi:MAG: hypothetical protein JOZ77_03540 [Candidatus Eremiobacteraeota bacterium]|nr:hypothetical protein [Candidatus Eremiobacteraeota bacterium]